MEALSHICEFNFPASIRWGRNFTNASIYHTLEDIAPSLNYSMFRCLWLNQNAPCSKYFAPVLSENGLCFSFNTLNSHEVFTDEWEIDFIPFFVKRYSNCCSWMFNVLRIAPEMKMINSRPNVSNWSLERGYKPGPNQNVYPMRVFSAKQSTALVVFLRLYDHDLEYVCRSLVPGFKIFLHTPGEVPAMSRKSYRVPAFEEAELTINPTFISTAHGLRSYKPNQRQCFFNNERQLRFFKIYAQTNCEAECLANFTQLECGCVQFSMPSELIYIVIHLVKFLTHPFIYLCRR